MPKFTLMQRVCWNDAGWQRPTGTCIHESGFPKDNGYGYEEWNLNTKDQVDGFVYGYVYSKPASWAIRESGGRFDIWFWAREPRTGKPLLVGAYRQASLALQDETSEEESCASSRQGVSLTAVPASS